MTGETDELIGLAVLLLLCLWGGWHHKKKRRWRALAQELGLEFSRGLPVILTPTISGVVRGFAVHVHRKTSWSSHDFGFCTRIKVSYPTPLPYGLLCCRAGLMNSLMQGSGIRTGDAVFDTWVHTSGDEQPALHVLNTEVRAAFVKLLDQNHHALITNGWLELTMRGFVAEPKRLRKRIQQALALAEQVHARAEKEVGPKEPKELVDRPIP